MLLFRRKIHHGVVVSSQPPHREEAFNSEVERVRSSGMLGESGRLFELFTYLSSRGFAAEAATQADIAEQVFGQTETTIDDATVRVYIHRLRKRLEEFYRLHGEQSGRLAVPAGTYALRLVQQGAEPSPTPVAPEVVSEAPPKRWDQRRLILLVVAALGLLVAAFVLGQATSGTRHKANDFWAPFLSSSRPKLIVLGDYYIYGEIDPVRPEEGRLIRDFRVDSAADLMRMQELLPDQFSEAEDVGLNYLPFSAAYGLQQIVPAVATSGQDLRVIPASGFQPNMLNEYDVVYVGLFSGMGLLEDLIFMGSGFRLGESYDELIDTSSGRAYISEEARSLSSPAYYRDFGYIARFSTLSGAQVAVVASERETGLRGIAPIVGEPELPQQLDELVHADGFEALFQITGQQGADLSERLLISRERTGAR